MASRRVNRACGSPTKGSLGVRSPCGRSRTTGWVPFLILVTVAAPASALQEEIPRDDLPVSNVYRLRPIVWTADTLPRVDILTRFESFQRDFDDVFGGDSRRYEGPGREGLGERWARRLESRFAGSTLGAWYGGAVDLIEDVEGIYERVESSTRWASRGFRLDADLESVVDGKVTVHLERRIHGFNVGLDAEDAVDGRFGLRLGGVVRGYVINLDVGDVEAGRMTFRLKKRLD